MTEPLRWGLIGTGWIADSLGLRPDSCYEIGQPYPAAETKQRIKIGEEVVWQVRPQSVVALSIATMTRLCAAGGKVLGSRTMTFPPSRWPCRCW